MWFLLVDPIFLRLALVAVSPGVMWCVPHFSAFSVAFLPGSDTTKMSVLFIAARSRSADLVTYESRVVLPLAMEIMRWCCVGSLVSPLLPRVVGAGKVFDGAESASSLSDPCVIFERLRGYAKKKSKIVCCALDSTSWSVVMMFLLLSIYTNY